MNETHRKRGVALIVVMVIMVISASIVTAILVRQYSDIQRTLGAAGQIQAYQYAIGAEELARQVLVADAVAVTNLDYPGERWAQLADGISVENGNLALRIEDMQGRFNVNTLISESQLPFLRFAALLSRLGLPANLGPRIVARIGTQKAPRPLTSSEELREVAGITPEIYARLAPFITVLPDTDSLLNVNTASDMVLQAYFPNEGEYARLKAALSKRGFITEGELNGIGMNTKGTGVSSQYFRLAALARIDGRAVTLASLLRRTVDTRGMVALAVISRNLSQRFREAG